MTRKPSVATTPNLIVMGRESRPTSKIGRDELRGLLNMSDAIVATKPIDLDALELQARDRKTQRMRSKHFQMLVRDGVTDTLPLSPDGIDDHADDSLLDVTQRAQRVTGLPRAQTLEYSAELLSELTAEVNLEIPLEHAEPPPRTAGTTREPSHASDAPPSSHASPRARRELGDLDEAAAARRGAAATVDVTREMLQDAAVNVPRTAASTLEVTPEMLQEIEAHAPRTSSPSMDLAPEMLAMQSAGRSAPATTQPTRTAASTMEVTPEMLEEVAAVRRGPVTLEIPAEAVEPASASDELDAIIRKAGAKTSSPGTAVDSRSEGVRSALQILPVHPRDLRPSTESEVIELPLKMSTVSVPSVPSVPSTPARRAPSEPEREPGKPAFDAVNLAALQATEAAAVSRPLRRFAADEPAAEPTPKGSGAGMLAVLSLLLVAGLVAFAVYALL